jgi:hypothetical protein
MLLKQSEGLKNMENETHKAPVIFSSDYFLYSFLYTVNLTEDGETICRYDLKSIGL